MNTTPEDLVAFLADAAKRSSFAASLTKQLARGGSLSPKQLECALNMQAKSAPPAAHVDLKAIRVMFDKAVQAGYKRPTYRAEGLVLSLAPAGGFNSGALYVKRDGEYMGKLVGTEFFVAPRVAAAGIGIALEAIASDPEAAAVRYGRETGTCACCGRTLTNETSIALGIGPVCRARWF